MVEPTSFFQSVSRTRRCLAIYWVLLAVGSHLPELAVGEDANQIGVFQVDKALHVVGFGGLAWLLYLSRLAGPKASTFAHALVAVCVGGVYALIDEYTQQFTGRQVTFSDVVAGLIAIVGVFLVLTAPEPLDKTPRYVVFFRVLAVMVMVAALIFVLAPDGRTWVQKILVQFMQPWRGIDKDGHFYVTALLTLLLIPSRLAGVNRPRRGVFLSIVVIGLAGPIIETAQMFTGREVEMRDLYAHQLGLLAGMTALAVLVILRHIRRPRPMTDQA